MPTNRKIVKKRCSACGNELSMVNGFYSTKSPLFAVDKKINICKKCFINECLEEIGEVDKDKLKNLLRRTDFPLYWDNLKSSELQFTKENGHIDKEDIKYHGAEIIKIYMKNVNSLRQLSSKTFADSEKDGFIQKNSTVLKKDPNKSSHLNTIQKKKDDDEIINFDSKKFEVTPDMINVFGEGYTRVEYKNMYRKYNDMKINYSIQTNLHQEALVTYVRFKVKEELATARGDVADAQKWYAAAQDAADKAKLTPKQLTQADLQGGINSFSEIFKAVEQAVDVIPILPHFKYRPNDALDFNIWCYINYARELQGLPQCTYQEVYKFYDKKKQEYLEQYGDPYGIFEDDPSEKNRPNVEKFTTLPKDYMDGDE